LAIILQKLCSRPSGPLWPLSPRAPNWAACH